jgi:glycosyltransferase involved in cell wall biosynthesis
MFRHYNPELRQDQTFLSHLVADNEHFRTRLERKPVARNYDVMFAGRIVELKNPVFFANVCAEIKKRLGTCRALVIGDGEEHLKARMRGILSGSGVECMFAGFIPHEELPDYYAQARLLLVPTSRDCWGVVINEAMISGTPVITTEWTAAAGELVVDEVNGFVLPLDASRWAEAACGLITCPEKWSAFSASACTKAAEFNYDNAASGLLAAFAYLEQEIPLDPPRFGAT